MLVTPGGVFDKPAARCPCCDALYSLSPKGAETGVLAFFFLRLMLSSTRFADASKASAVNTCNRLYSFF
jgi:hypothetical protein